MFEQTFVHSGRAVRKPWTLAASLTGQLILVAFIVAVPLLKTAQLKFTPSMVVYSPPRVVQQAIQQASKAVAQSSVPTPRIAFQPRFAGPTRIPEKIVPITEAPSQSFVGVGISGVGSQDLPFPFGDTLAQPKPPVQPQVKQATSRQNAIRVGTGVQQAMLIHEVKPVYPPLARSARISGVVRLTAVIAKDGSIQKLQVISGHPLLVKDALTAVQQWRYKPTLLSGEPVEVITEIDVNFTLSN